MVIVDIRAGTAAGRAHGRARGPATDHALRAALAWPGCSSPPAPSTSSRDRRRLLAILLTSLAGTAVVVFLVARGELAGADARAYWGGVRVWLDGGSPMAPPAPYLPYVYAPWSVPIFLPWALLPWDVAWFVWRGVNVLLLLWSASWAYRQHPLATAILLCILAAPIAATLDTGNITLLCALGIWAAPVRRAAAGRRPVGAGHGAQVVPGTAVAHPAGARPTVGAHLDGPGARACARHVAPDGRPDRGGHRLPATLPARLPAAALGVRALGLGAAATAGTRRVAAAGPRDRGLGPDRSGPRVRSADRPAHAALDWTVRHARSMLGLGAPAATAPALGARRLARPARTGRLTAGTPPDPTRQRTRDRAADERAASTTRSTGPPVDPEPVAVTPHGVAPAPADPGSAPSASGVVVRRGSSRLAPQQAGSGPHQPLQHGRVHLAHGQERIDPLDEAQLAAVHVAEAGERRAGPAGPPPPACRAARMLRADSRRYRRRASAPAGPGPAPRAPGGWPARGVSSSSTTGASKQTATASGTSMTHTARAGLRRHRSPGR